MTALVPAAEYVRMSTEHQQYSTENQSDVIREYAHKRGYEIVRTFTDAGKSGLRIDGRHSLKALIDVVQQGKAEFRAIIVYDVSRWGRFQDADESAYYEYICKRAGIHVVYCAEQFENDGSPVSTIVKGVKRAMAGEYSRELSAKVFKGQCKLIENGFRQGGPAGVGLRRMLIDQAGAPKAELALGEQKSIQTDRVVLVPGPEAEIALVRRIYDTFINERVNERHIAERLNAEGLLTDRGRVWTRGTVHQVLTNEKYIGHNVYNRVSFKLKKKRVRNPEDMWVRSNDAFEPVVDSQLFFTARGLILGRHQRIDDADMLARLRALRERTGRVSGILIDEADDMPSTSAYRHRFGSLVRAYELIGYTPERDYAFIEVNRRLRALHPAIVREVTDALQRVGGTVVWDESTDMLRINGMLSVSIVLSKYETSENGAPHWQVRLDSGLGPDLTIAVRMDGTNAAALDYYVLPALDLHTTMRLRESNGAWLDAFRFNSLDYVFGMAEQISVEVAA